MNEAPKKIWVEHEYREWSFKPSDFEDGTETTQYIRADLVDELVGALEFFVNDYEGAEGMRSMNIYADKSRAALAKARGEG